MFLSVFTFIWEVNSYTFQTGRIALDLWLSIFDCNFDSWFCAWMWFSFYSLIFLWLLFNLQTYDLVNCQQYLLENPKSFISSLNSVNFTIWVIYTCTYIPLIFFHLTDVYHSPFYVIPWVNFSYLPLNILLAIFHFVIT